MPSVFIVRRCEDAREPPASAKLMPNRPQRANDFPILNPRLTRVALTVAMVGIAEGESGQGVRAGVSCLVSELSLKR